jgi:hypothetical protein
LPAGTVTLSIRRPLTGQIEQVPRKFYATTLGNSVPQCFVPRRGAYTPASVCELFVRLDGKNGARSVQEDLLSDAT